MSLRRCRKRPHSQQPYGSIVQFGGQTPLEIARAFGGQGVKILGTSPHQITAAEDRREFGALLRSLDILHPAYGIADRPTEVESIAESTGYPVLVRPSFVLGGRAMKIVYDHASLERYLNESIRDRFPMVISIRWGEFRVQGWVTCDDVLYCSSKWRTSQTDTFVSEAGGLHGLSLISGIRSRGCTP